MTNQSRSWTWIHWLGGTFHPASTGLTWDIRGSTEPSGPGIEFSHQEKWQNTCGCKRIQCVTIHRVQSMKTNIGIQKKRRRRRTRRKEKREEIWSDFSVDVQKIVPHNPCGFLMRTNHQLPEDWVSVKGWDSPATSFCREQHNNRMHQLQFNFIQSWVMIGFFPHWKLSNWLFCISPENCACTLFWDTRPARFH